MIAGYLIAPRKTRLPETDRFDVQARRLGEAVPGARMRRNRTCWPSRAAALLLNPGSVFERAIEALG